MKSLLFDYIKEISSYNPEIYDNLKMDINNKIYFHGMNFKYSPENRKNRYKLITKKLILIPLNIIKSILLLYKNSYKKNYNNISQGNRIKKVLFLSKMPLLENEILKKGFEINHLNSFSSLKEIYITLKSFNLRKKILLSNFKELIDKSFIDKVLKYKQDIKEYYKNKDIKALFIHNNVTFFESIFIDIFEELNIPSFELVHGYPSIYWNFPNKANYTLVWSEKMKNNFIKISGMKPDKILVSGNPAYQNPTTKELKFGLKNILILHKDNTGWGSKIYFDKLDVITSDIGNSIGYLYSIQNVLKKFGIGSVRLRIHPGEDPNWYKKYIDTSFFIFDNESLSESLLKSSLVIGPGSTVFLEALYYGVNYLIYEPREGNFNIMGFPLVPPFDGSDYKVPVAIDEETLYSIIKNKQIMDRRILYDYIKMPFDLSFLDDIIK